MHLALPNIPPFFHSPLLSILFLPSCGFRLSIFGVLACSFPPKGSLNFFSASTCSMENHMFPASHSIFYSPMHFITGLQRYWLTWAFIQRIWAKTVSGFTEVVGRIQFLVVVRLRSRFPCWPYCGVALSFSRPTCIVTTLPAPSSHQQQHHVSFSHISSPRRLFPSHLPLFSPLSSPETPVGPPW